ncbi:MAG: hypothetical protein ACAI37_12415 [Chthoniobacter sp.]
MGEWANGGCLCFVEEIAPAGGDAELFWGEGWEGAAENFAIFHLPFAIHKEGEEREEGESRLEKGFGEK